MKKEIIYSIHYIASYPDYLLIFPTIFIFFFTYFITNKYCKNSRLSFVISAIKSLAFLYYYSAFDGSMILKDDIGYLWGGIDLERRGVTLFNITRHINDLFIVGRGLHFSYYLINEYAFKLFGIGYFAPVAINLVLSSFVSYFGSKIAVEYLGYPPYKGRLFFLFLSINVDIFTWSLVMNGKDTLLLLLTILLFYGYFKFSVRKNIKGLLLVALVSVVLFFTRYYIPFAFAGTILFRIVIKMRTSFKKVLLIGVFGVGGLLLSGYIVSGMTNLLENMGNPIFGMIRFLLTPNPLNLEYKYRFLFLSSIVNWIGIPFLISGIVIEYKNRNENERLVFWYMFITILFYGAFPALQGPRHRVQLNMFLSFYIFSSIFKGWQSLRVYQKSMLSGMQQLSKGADDVAEPTF